MELSFETRGTGVRSALSLSPNSIKRLASHQNEVADDSDVEIENEIIAISEALNEEKEKQSEDSDNPDLIDLQQNNDVAFNENEINEGSQGSSPRHW